MDDRSLDYTNDDSVSTKTTFTTLTIDPVPQSTNAPTMVDEMGQACRSACDAFWSFVIDEHGPVVKKERRSRHKLRIIDDETTEVTGAKGYSKQSFRTGTEGRHKNKNNSLRWKYKGRTRLPFYDSSSSDSSSNISSDTEGADYSEKGSLSHNGKEQRQHRISTGNAKRQKDMRMGSLETSNGAYTETSNTKDSATVDSRVLYLRKLERKRRDKKMDDKLDRSHVEITPKAATTVKSKTDIINPSMGIGLPPRPQKQGAHIDNRSPVLVSTRNVLGEARKGIFKQTRIVHSEDVNATPAEEQEDYQQEPTRFHTELPVERNHFFINTSLSRHRTSSFDDDVNSTASKHKTTCDAERTVQVDTNDREELWHPRKQFIELYATTNYDELSHSEKYQKEGLTHQKMTATSTVMKHNELDNDEYAIQDKDEYAIRDEKAILRDKTVVQRQEPYLVVRKHNELDHDEYAIRDENDVSRDEAVVQRQEPSTDTETIQYIRSPSPEICRTMSEDDKHCDKMFSEGSSSRKHKTGSKSRFSTSISLRSFNSIRFAKETKLRARTAKRYDQPIERSSSFAEGSGECVLMNRPHHLMKKDTTPNVESEYSIAGSVTSLDRREKKRTIQTWRLRDVSSVC